MVWGVRLFWHASREFHSFECLYPGKVVFTLRPWNLGWETSRLRLFFQAVVATNWLRHLYGLGSLVVSGSNCLLCYLPLLGGLQLEFLAIADWTMGFFFYKKERIMNNSGQPRMKHTPHFCSVPRNPLACRVLFF